eukprot:m.170993 g.170993  ORF g.170993 m.170993 type:complete len:566 (-) comp10383_c0_seq2:2567-4264(-)
MGREKSASSRSANKPKSKRSRRSNSALPRPQSPEIAEEEAAANTTSPPAPPADAAEEHDVDGFSLFSNHVLATAAAPPPPEDGAARSTVNRLNRKRPAAPADEDHDGDGNGSSDDDDAAAASNDGSQDRSEATFESLGLSRWLVQQVHSMGMSNPTPVQVHCIPRILRGLDCIGSAKTGSGKTAAFALPVLETLSKDPYGVYCVVLTPTRELAFQIGEQFDAFGKPLNIRCSVVVGGLDMMTQATELSRRPHVIVATPGRLADHLLNRSLSLNRVKYFVLDEADRLLTNDTLQEDLGTIIEHLPKARQTMLFSATMPTGIDKLATLRQPVYSYEAPSPIATVSKLDQRYVFMPSHVRHCFLVNVVRSLEKKTVIIFTSTCKSAEEINLMLRHLGMRCCALHSEMGQQDRLSSLAKFRSSIVDILIATDVASRGLDIPLVDAVVNFNVPLAVEDYIHRVGRTARAGRGGLAVTLVSERDIALVHAIEGHVGVKMSLFDDLEEKTVLQSLNEVSFARRAASQKLLEMDFGVRKKRRRERKQLAALADRDRQAKSAGKKKAGVRSKKT